MRAYGRFMKNIAALALLFALLSLLLPFCSFQAAGQDMTLSGLDVLKAGGSAAYTAFFACETVIFSIQILQKKLYFQLFLLCSLA